MPWATATLQTARFSNGVSRRVKSLVPTLSLNELGRSFISALMRELVREKVSKIFTTRVSKRVNQNMTFSIRANLKKRK